MEVGDCCRNRRTVSKFWVGKGEDIEMTVVLIGVEVIEDGVR